MGNSNLSLFDIGYERPWMPETAHVVSVMLVSSSSWFRSNFFKYSTKWIQLWFRHDSHSVWCMCLLNFNFFWLEPNSLKVILHLCFAPSKAICFCFGLVLPVVLEKPHYFHFLPAFPHKSLLVTLSLAPQHKHQSSPDSDWLV